MIDNQRVTWTAFAIFAKLFTNGAKKIPQEVFPNANNTVVGTFGFVFILIIVAQYCSLLADLLSRPNSVGMLEEVTNFWTEFKKFLFLISFPPNTEYNSMIFFNKNKESTSNIINRVHLEKCPEG